MVLLLVVFPTVYILGLSLTESSLARPFQEFTGVENFQAALAEEAFRGSLFRTTIFAFTAAAVELILGTLLALALWKRKAGFGFTGTILLLPMVTPPVMVAVVWQVLISPAGGGLTGAWTALGVAPPEIFAQGSTAFAALLAVEVWQWTPFVMLLVYAALLGLDHEQVEAAQLDGAGRWSLLRYILLPAVETTLVMVFLFRVLGGFKVFDVAYAVTHGGPGFSTTFSSFAIFRTAFDGSFDTGSAAAMTLMFGLVVGLATAVLVYWRRASLSREG